MKLKIYIAILLMFILPSLGDGMVEKFLQIPPPKPELNINFTGEYLKYEVRWLGIRSGEAELWVEEVNGNYIIKGVSKTVGLARVLWRMDDWIELETTKDLKPIVYKLHLREPTIKADQVMVLDPDSKQAISERKWINISKIRVRKLDFYQGFDPASLAGLVRTLNWEPGEKKFFELLDGSDRYLVLVEAGPIEQVKTRLNTYQAIRLTPYLFELPHQKDQETSALVEKIEKKMAMKNLAEDVYIWMALTGTRPFVKIWGKAFIGVVEIELLAISQCPKNEK